MKRLLLLSLLALAGCQSLKMPCSDCTQHLPAHPVVVADAGAGASISR
jgi:hypothetical protein